MSTGLFGTSSSFVPLAEAEVHGDDVHVPYTKETISDAPRVAPDSELNTHEDHPLRGALARRNGARRDRRARLREYVVTETVTRTVAVSHEELRIVREPLEPGAQGLPTVTELSEEEHEVVLAAQRPVVEKEIVAVERIRLEKETVSGEETVREQVRKEQVEVADLPPAETSALPRPEQRSPRSGPRASCSWRPATGRRTARTCRPRRPAPSS